MGDNQDPKKKNANVAFKPENHAFASASGNITQFVNDLIDKVRSGQWVDAAAIAAGKQQLVCIYNMPDSKTLDMTCPVKHNHRFLCGDDRLGDLLSACRQCPRKQEYLHLVKQGHRGDRPAPAAATVQPPKVLEFTIKCTEAGCSKEWDSAYYEDRKDPMMDMHHAIAAHLNLEHGIGAVPHEMSPHRMQEKLKQEMQQP